MMFPLYNAIEILDRNQIEAARDLGAPWWHIHLFVVMPYAKPGIASGATLVFMLCAGALAAPLILGGPKTLWFTPIVYDRFFQAFNWQQGAAYALILLSACMVFVLAGDAVVQGQPFGDRAMSSRLVWRIMLGFYFVLFFGFLFGPLVDHVRHRVQHAVLPAGLADRGVDARTGSPSCSPTEIVMEGLDNSFIIGAFVVALSVPLGLAGAIVMTQVYVAGARVLLSRRRLAGADARRHHRHLDRHLLEGRDAMDGRATAVQRHRCWRRSASRPSFRPIAC